MSDHKSSRSISFESASTLAVEASALVPGSKTSPVTRHGIVIPVRTAQGLYNGPRARLTGVSDIQAFKQLVCLWVATLLWSPG